MASRAARSLLSAAGAGGVALGGFAGPSTSYAAPALASAAGSRALDRWLVPGGGAWQSRGLAQTKPEGTEGKPKRKR